VTPGDGVVTVEDAFTREKVIHRFYCDAVLCARCASEADRVIVHALATREDFPDLFADETKNTTQITNDNNNDNKVKIFSRVKISFCRKDTHTTKRI